MFPFISAPPERSENNMSSRHIQRQYKYADYFKLHCIVQPREKCMSKKFGTGIEV
jgi:hypothetical protein